MTHVSAQAGVVKSNSKYYFRPNLHITSCWASFLIPSVFHNRMTICSTTMLISAPISIVIVWVRMHLKPHITYDHRTNITYINIHVWHCVLNVRVVTYIRMSLCTTVLQHCFSGWPCLLLYYSFCFHSLEISSESEFGSSLMPMNI